jgi:hypothetical protein
MLRSSSTANKGMIELCLHRMLGLATLKWNNLGVDEASRRDRLLPVRSVLTGGVDRFVTSVIAIVSCNSSCQFASSVSQGSCDVNGLRLTHQRANLGGTAENEHMGALAGSITY